MEAPVGGHNRICQKECAYEMKQPAKTAGSVRLYAGASIAILGEERGGTF